MVEGLIARLAKAIGYPQEVPAEAEAFDFLVDGDAINVSLADDSAALIFRAVLTEDEELAGRLAAFAAGRLMKEKSVLAWDPEKRAGILWERIEGFEGKLRRAFESFCESVDWWRERVKEEGREVRGAPAMMIRP